MTFNTIKIKNHIKEAYKDWPKFCQTLNEFENEISTFIGSEVDKNNLNAFLNEDIHKGTLENIWEMESLSSLYLAFEEISENITFKDLIRKINNNDL